MADDLTHAIGDTGYMIREAMQAKANKHAKDAYNQALRLQSEAKDYLRGSHKKGPNRKLAMDLTKQAYALAKQARDNSLNKK